MKILIFGATSTIAQDLQKLWAQQGHSMILIGRNREKLNEIAQDLTVRGGKTNVIVKDLMDYSDADNFVNSIWLEHNGFDLAFMAHGVLGSQRQDEKSAKKSVQILDANLISHAAFLTPIANHFEATGKGAIAVITSVAGDRAKQSNYIYGAAKAGKIAFVAGLRNRLAAKGIPVTELRLGFVDTAMTSEFKKGILWAKSESIARSIDHAIKKKKDIAYLPFFWKFIMMIIKSIPEMLFKKLNL